MTINREGEQRPYMVTCFIDMSRGIYPPHLVRPPYWVKSAKEISVRNILYNQRLKRFCWPRERL